MRKSTVSWPLLALSLLGCGDDPKGSAGSGFDAGEELCLRQLDLLLVVDNTVAKTLVHERLSVALPRFLSGLSSGDLNHDGTAELTPFSDIHVGVVTADMGVFAQGDAQCSERGNDGVLLSRSLSGECKGEAHPYQIYIPSEESQPETLIEHTQCLASVGLQRCAYEQPLESLYKALAPATVSFHGGTTGHGSAENAGFLRENAVLAVVVLTDEDDCSVTESGAIMFERDPTDARLKSPDSDKPIGASLRCALSATKQAADPSLGLLHPVSRYVEGLKALKPKHPERVVLGVIAGIPLDAQGTPPAAVLTRPELLPVAYIPEGSVEPGVDPLVFDQTQLTPGCEDDVSKVSAAPAPRLVEAAKGFGENGLVGSVCAAGYDGLLDAVAGRISAELEECQCDPDLDVDAGGCAED